MLFCNLFGVSLDYFLPLYDKQTEHNMYPTHWNIYEFDELECLWTLFIDEIWLRL